MPYSTGRIVQWLKTTGLLGAIAVAPVFVLALLHVPYPLGTDQAMFLYGAHELADGAHLYVDFWDMKQPGVFWFCQLAGTLFGFDAVGLHTFELLWMVGLAVALFALARELLEEKWLALLAPVACLAIYYAGATNLRLTVVEMLVSLPIALFALCIVRSAGSPERIRARHVAAGSLAIVVAIFKLMLGLIPALLFLAVLVHDALVSRVSVRELLVRRILPMLGGLLLGAAILAIYLGVKGELGAALWATFRYPVFAIAQYPHAPLSRLLRSIAWVWQENHILVPLLAVGTVIAVVRRRWRALLIPVIWIGAAGIAVFMQVLSWWLYQMVVFFVPLGLLALLGLDAMIGWAKELRTVGRVRSAAAIAGVGALFLLVVVGGIARHAYWDIGRYWLWGGAPRPWADLRAFQENVDPDLRALHKSVAFLREPTARPGRIGLLGDPRVLFLSDRRPVTEINGWSYYLRAQLDQAARDLAQHRPPYVYVSSYIAHLHNIGTTCLYRTVLGLYTPRSTDDLGGTWLELNASASAPPDCMARADDRSMAEHVSNIRIEPSSLVLQPGEERALAAFVVSADGKRRDVSTQVTWTTTDRSVATIKQVASGERAIMAGTRGVANVVARLGEVEGYSVLAVSEAAHPSGPLHADAQHPRYLVDARGNPVYLTGSHTWSNFQDNGPQNPPPAFPYEAMLDALQGYNHNFMRLWRWEQGSWTSEVKGDYHVTPMPFERTGPGNALDGAPKYDLTRFNQAYFDRLRSRVAAARERGIFVSVMLFSGWSIEPKGDALSNPWRGHPLNRDNNINGIDGDTNHDEAGLETQRLDSPAVLAVQEAYVRKVLDTLGDLDNVLYEISNESTAGSAPWQYHMIDFIKQYEKRLPNPHPVGMTVERPFGSNDVLFASHADWVSPTRTSMHPMDPQANYAPKPILYDTDHLCGVCGTQDWVWASLTRGVNPVMMDGWDPGIGLGAVDQGGQSGAVWDLVRRNLGYARSLATLLDLRTVEPFTLLTDSDHVLGNPASEPPQFLMYLREKRTVTIDLNGVEGWLSVTWLDPRNGRVVPGMAVKGGAERTLSSPLFEDSVLFLDRLPPSRH